MAEDTKNRENVLEDMEKEITCAICQCIYNKAKLLPCNHYFCTTCIEKIAARHQPFHCPECRKEINIAPGEISRLPPAFFVERLKDLYTKMAIEERNLKANCGMCEGAAKPVVFCRQCIHYICSDCLTSHQTQKAFEGHDIASLEDPRRTASIGGKDALLKKCGEHGKTLKLFCFECKCLICRDCILIEHKEHKFEFVKKCAAENRKTLTESMSHLQQIQGDMTHAITTIEAEKGNVDIQKQEVVKSITHSFEALKTSLDERRRELVGETNTLAEAKQDALEDQRSDLQTGKKEIQRLVDSVQKTLQETSDQDLVKMNHTLLAKMEEEGKRHKHTSLELVTTADIACNIPSPDVIPSGLGSVFIQPEPTITEAVELCRLGHPVRATLCAPTASVNEISATLKCVSNPLSSVEGEVFENGTGVFSISIIPDIRGRHELIVKVKGKMIGGSPVSIFVKYPLSQLVKAKPTMIGNLSCPWQITVNNQDQLVVTETGNKKISVIDRQGKPIRSIIYDKFNDPRGVAVAPDGTIYATDTDTECLLKISSDGDLLKSVHGQLRNPYSVEVVNNQVCVVDTDSQLVKIFDTDCNVIGNIETKECPEPVSLANGPDGIYVAGKKKICVYKCIPNGGLIRRVKFTPTSLKLSEFNGICFDGSGHIVASDWDNGVYVFTQSGSCMHHITSNVIPYPAGVTVDRDGFLYVCNFSFSNSKVFVF